jgi:hypothetical protein
MSAITIDQCKKWMACPNINPLTGRKIITCGRVYEVFRKQCIAYNLETKSSTKTCQAKWIAFNCDEAGVYDKSLVKRCKYCKKTSSYAILHFIHARDDSSVEDYECARCNESGNLAYFCFACKNREEEN